MFKEFTKTAASVEEATQLALNDIKNEFGDAKFTYETIIIESPKKKLFGGFKGEAIVKLNVEIEEKAVAQELSKLDVAVKYVDDILQAMNLEDISYDVEQNKDNVTIVLKGESIGVLIGHHGETLDALQYLIALSCSRTPGEYFRITLDGGNYREKREATLKDLAFKISEKVKKTGRSQMLEPMNPYERRIIHAVVSDVAGVFSKSKGEDPNRRVIIISETPSKTFNKNTNTKNNSGNNAPNNRVKPQFNKNQNEPVKKYERGPSVEDMLKSDKKPNDDSSISGKLYSKIEL